jgi:hypothetical protein
MCTECTGSNDCTQWTCTENYFLDITLGTYGACTICLDDCDLCSTSTTCDVCKLGYNHVVGSNGEPDTCIEPAELVCSYGETLTETTFADLITEYTLRVTTNAALAVDSEAERAIFDQKEAEFNYYKSTLATNLVDTYCLKYRTTKKA